MPALRTCAIVFRRSSYTRVVIDVAVKFRRSVEIVVVSGEAGTPSGASPALRSACRACSRLPYRAPRRRATISSTRSNSFAVRHLPPRRAHAESCRSFGSSRAWRSRATTSRIHQLFAHHAVFVVRALRAISAILGAAARLDRKQPAELHLVGLVKAAMRESAPGKSAREAEDRRSANFLARPVVANVHRQRPSFRLSKIPQARAITHTRFNCPVALPF